MEPSDNNLQQPDLKQEREGNKKQLKKQMASLGLYLQIYVIEE
jgi:hypothetical protein